MNKQHNILSATAAEKEATPKRPNEKPPGPIEEAEQDAKDPTHEKEVSPKSK